MSAHNNHRPVSFADITAARERIQHRIHRTPIVTSASLNALCGVRVFLKCENFQRAGVFKARGAFNAVFSLSEPEAARGVVTSSSGNQAAALSLAARTRGIRAHIAMPRIAVKAKIAAVQRYGGNIVWVESRGAVPTAEEYDATVARIQSETHATAVHPYDDARTIAGQGTCALEFLEDCPDLDLVLAPVGGGGLLAGTAVAVKALNAAVRVIGCEPAAADDAQRSLRSGHRVTFQEAPRTIADGLRTSLGELTFAIISKDVDDIVTVTEESIVRAMRLAWEVLKVIIEPSSAVALAALTEKRLPGVDGKRVGVIVSGGNADLDQLPWTKQSP
jgi:threonine dehydratase